jgi:hypothetical protein
MAYNASTTSLLVRVIVAFALIFALGYERELRDTGRQVVRASAAVRPTVFAVP